MLAFHEKEVKNETDSKVIKGDTVASWLKCCTLCWAPEEKDLVRIKCTVPLQDQRMQEMHIVTFQQGA